MKKTALQELINKWEIETGSYIPNASIYKAFIEEAKLFLEQEKEQITSAYCQGSIDSVLNENLETFSEQYYKEHYGKME